MRQVADIRVSTCERAVAGMASLIWNSARTVGVRMIDEQHGILFDALNEIRFAFRDGAERETVRGMVDRMKELVRLHVESEERLLEQQGFPEVAKYRAEQHRLLNSLHALPKSREGSSGLRQTDSLHGSAESLREWFLVHIDGLQDYGPWLQENGVR